MQNKTVFEHKKELDKLPIVYPFNKCKIDENYYNVNKQLLLDSMPLEKRVASYLLPPNPTDKMILTTIVNTINGVASFLLGKQKKPNISFVELEGENYANFEGTKITLSLSSLFDHRIPLETRVNSVIATGLHEIAHCIFTTPGVGQLLIQQGYTTFKISHTGKLEKIPNYSKVSNLFKNNLHKNLLNIVEDYRIERALLSKWSGYVFYFDDERKYVLWNKINFIESNKQKEDVYKRLFEYIMYRVLLPEALDVFLKSFTQDSLFNDLINKVNDIIKKEPVTFTDALNLATDLLSLFPEEAQQQLSKSMKEKEFILIPLKLTGEEKKLLKEICESVLKNEEIEKIKIKNSFALIEDIEIKPAEKTIFDNNTYQEALKLSKQIANNLSFIDSRFNRLLESYEMLQGELDESELYSLGFSKNVFFEEEETPGYNLELGILIDESGSMSGDKINNARIVALALALALKDSKHINLSVYGHTANDSKTADISMFCYFDKVKKVNDINTLFSIKSRSNNADGFAIQEYGNILKARKAKMKVMIVISDGQPHAYGYQGKPAIKHTKNVVEELERNGIFIVQIAIESFDSASMFKNFVPYEKGSSLGANLKKVLQKKLVEISNLI